METRISKSHPNQAALILEAKGEASEMRAFLAWTHRVAAQVEEATPATERWVLHLDGHESWGGAKKHSFRAQLWIELEGTEMAREAKAANELLAKIAKG